MALIRASDRSQQKKSNFAGFLGTNLQRNWVILWEFSTNFRGKLRRARAFNVFLTEVVICSNRLSTTIRSRNEQMAKPLASWLVPSFRKIIRLVILKSCLHVSVTKFKDTCKFASLRQVNRPNS